MDAQFWHTRWARGEIGFHQAEVNAWLRQYWPVLGLGIGQRVFVPLAGKSLDMLWLREQGVEVIGIELSEKAVQAFFEENGLRAECGEHRAMRYYQAPGIRLYCGDFFQLDAHALRGAQGVYDRAALIALPPAMRPAYVRHLRGMLTPGTRWLLVSFEYPQGEMDGPPFSVEPGELQDLLAEGFELSLLRRESILEREPRWRTRGLSRLSEAVYCLRRL